jgi:hypothetical protein
MKCERVTQFVDQDNQEPTDSRREAGAVGDDHPAQLRSRYLQLISISNRQMRNLAKRI